MKPQEPSFYQEASKDFPSNGLQTALELLDSQIQIIKVGDVVGVPWSPSRSGENTPPPPIRLVSPLPLRFLSRVQVPIFPFSPGFMTWRGTHHLSLALSPRKKAGRWGSGTAPEGSGT